MEEKEPTPRQSLGSFLLRPPGQAIHTDAAGELVIYPPTVKTARVLEKRFGDMLDGETPDAVFDAYLMLAASQGASEPDTRGLSAQALSLLSPDDKAALARAGLADLDAHEGTPGFEQPVAEYVARMARQGELVRKQRRDTNAKLASLGLIAGSPALRAFEESNRASDLIKMALGPSLASQIAKFNDERVMPLTASHAKLAEHLQQTASVTPPEWAMPPRLEPSDFIRPMPPLDLHKSAREHQAKLEKAGETVIELAEAAVHRINTLADFAQAFQLESAESGRRNLTVAKWALIISALLSLLQLAYTRWKDVHDGPRDDEQMILLREHSAAARQENALLRDMLENARRDRGVGRAAPAPPDQAQGPRPGPEAIPSSKSGSPTSAPSPVPGGNVPTHHGRRAATDPMRDGAT